MQPPSPTPSLGKNTGRGSFYCSYQLVSLGHVWVQVGPLDVQLSSVLRARRVDAAQLDSLSEGLLNGLGARGRHLHRLCLQTFS